MLIESIRCRERAKKRGNIWHIASKQHYFTWKLLHTILPCRQCVDDVAESQECDDHYKASHCVVKYADELTEWIKQFEGTCFKSWKPRGIGDDNCDLFNQSGNIMAKYDNKKTKYLLTASLYLSNYCCNASVPSNVFLYAISNFPSTNKFGWSAVTEWRTKRNRLLNLLLKRQEQFRYFCTAISWVKLVANLIEKNPLEATRLFHFRVILIRYFNRSYKN